MRLPVLPSNTRPRAVVEARGGMRVRQQGCIATGVVGGWLVDRASGQPRLVTVAHILAPRAALVARTPSMPPLPAVLAHAGDGPLLSVGCDPVPVARVTAAGVCDPYGRCPSFDVAIAAPLSAAAVPEHEPAVRLCDASIGRAVVATRLDGSIAEGTVIATDWPSGHYGATHDVLLDSSGDAPLSVAGMSGAWVRDASTDVAIAMIVGTIRGQVVDGVAYEELVCAHPLTRVADCFGIAYQRPKTICPPIALTNREKPRTAANS